MIPIAKPLISDEEKQAVMKVLDSGIIAAGPKTDEFEKKFSDFIGTKHAIATSSGTTALHLGLLCLSIKKDDEVIIPAFSFIATANTVLFCDAKPVFCDIDPETYNIDPEKIEDIITPKTKAIMPVHLYGQPADMKPIQEIADNHGFKIIGDAAQAHGASYNGKKIGTFGDLECFSFYPTKNMTTGEGGMITSNDKELIEKANSIRNHGREKNNLKYEHGRIGYNYRMTDITAAIGLEQLKKLPGFNKKRKTNARYYDQKLKCVETPFVIKNAEHVYHQYTIKHKSRDKLIKILKENKIGYGIYYPKPLHFYPHLKKYGHNNLKNSEKVSKEVISIPVHPSIEKNDLEKIVEVVSMACQDLDK